MDTLEADLAAAQEEEAELVRELEQLRVEEKAVEEELAAQTEAICPIGMNTKEPLPRPRCLLSSKLGYRVCIRDHSLKPSQRTLTAHPLSPLSLLQTHWNI